MRFRCVVLVVIVLTRRQPCALISCTVPQPPVGPTALQLYTKETA